MVSDRLNRELYSTLVMIGLIILVALLHGCGGSDDESDAERTTRLLQSATWQLNRLTVDGTDKTDLYPGMTLTISAGIYSAAHGDPVWPASGTWKLTDASTIDRDGDVTVKIDHLDAQSLTVSLSWSKTTYGGGRASSVSGAHVFELVKK